MAGALRTSRARLSPAASQICHRCERAILRPCSGIGDLSRHSGSFSDRYYSDRTNLNGPPQSIHGSVNRSKEEPRVKSLGFRPTELLRTQQTTTPRPTTLSSPASPSPASSSNSVPTSTKPSHQKLSDGLNDSPITLDEGGPHIDWAQSFHGLSTQPFAKEVSDVLLKPLHPDDIEIKPDGILYLPEIKYRRILNKAFGPGGWGLAPRSETIVTDKSVTREYALVALGRLISVARGEQDYFSSEGIPTATEGCKSNAMMRCCKDLGVASELWDPRFIRKFMASHTKEVFVEHALTKKRRKIWLRKDEDAKYPYKETSGFRPST